MTTAMDDGCDLLGALVEGIWDDNNNPYRNSLVVCAGAVLLTFVVSTLTRNYSQVDKLWSILPVIYAWIPAYFNSNPRNLLMAVVITVWGVRLTWNFHRRGGYSWPPWSGDEDYRWAAIQEGKFVSIMKNPIIWTLFNLFFISIYQNVLLWLTATPSLVAYTQSTTCNHPPELGIMDYTATALVLMFIVVEGIADNQQYRFQTDKYVFRKTEKVLTGDYADGFLQSGLFAIVRKPNYASEQAIWISFYLFTMEGKQKVNWSILGCIMLCLLFQVSGWFTELLTNAKYPKYKEYQKRVPLYLPNPFLSQGSRAASK